jgi:DNA-binding LacI/PurR family transcriptional regulator
MTATTSRVRRRTGPSIEDVARLAGVSAQTVSRVSTGSDKVRPETRDRVVAAMNQLGYSPNHAARALRSGAFRTIGLVAHRFERTGEALTTEAVLAAAEAEDYAVTIVNVRTAETDSWENAASRLSHQAIDGLVIIRAEQDTPESLALPAGLAVAVSDSRLAGYYPAVGADHVQGSTDATRHLLELGHRTVHHLAGPADSDPANVRAAAWQRTLEHAGIRPPQPWRGDWSARSGYEIGHLVAADPDVTALFCANDEMAIGVVRALHEHGRRVPDDISIVGFDDIMVSEFLWPPLTTVRQDFRRIGAELVRLVVEQIGANGRATPHRVLVPTTLVVRGTTSAPAASVGRELSGR